MLSTAKIKTLEKKIRGEDKKLLKASKDIAKVWLTEERTEEELAKEIFNALKSNDREKLNSLCPLVKQAGNVGSITKKEKKAKEKGIEGEIKRERGEE